MTRRIVNIGELSFETLRHGESFEVARGRVGRRPGSRKLGYNVSVLPPGKRAFP